MRWYNCEHKHSKIRFVTPDQRHKGEDQQILRHRKAVLELAKEKVPARWGSRATRNCTAIGAVTLNPDRETKVIEEKSQAA